MENTVKNTTYIGNHVHSLDGKNRAVMPKKWRGEGENGGAFMVRYHESRGYLIFYPPKQVALLHKRVSLIVEDDDRHDLEQELFGDSFELEHDAAGRITLPERLVAQAGFKKEGQVVFVAQGEYFSLWDFDRYEAHKAQRAKISVLERLKAQEQKSAASHDAHITPSH